jgi:hypothetical protein
MVYSELLFYGWRNGMRKVWSLRVLVSMMFGCVLLAGCGKSASIEEKEKQAIQLVKAFKTGEEGFTVVSNIQKKSEDDNRAGNKWDSTENWTAGLPSQKDLMLERLSEFFNVFRPTGDYWVRFSYKDKDGVHEGMWEVNIYSKKVASKNEVAEQLSKGS